MQPRSLPTRHYTSMRCDATNSYIGKSVHLLLRQTTYVCMYVCNLRTHIPEGRLSDRRAHQHVQQTVLPRWTNCPASKITELKAARYLCAVRAKHFAWKSQNDELLRFWHKSHRFAGRIDTNFCRFCEGLTCAICAAHIKWWSFNTLYFYSVSLLSMPKWVIFQVCYLYSTYKTLAGKPERKGPLWKAGF